MTSQAYSPPADRGLEIIYQDEDLLVIEKPSGLLSVPGRGENKQDSLALRVQDEFPEALIVHRLDMETSGILLMARNPNSQRALGRLFELRRIGKIYIAVVSGRVKRNAGEINLPLLADWPNRPRQKIDTQQGKPAQTTYRVLQYDTQRNITRVELIPKTGRSHQLRVHMQAIGHPICGDKLYNNGAINNPVSRLLLHATSLAFIHPTQNKPMELNSPAPF